MNRQRSFSFQLLTRSLVFYFSIFCSIIFLTSIIIWLNKTTPSNSVPLPSQETAAICLQYFNCTSSSLVSVGMAVQTNLTAANFHANISTTVNAAPEDSIFKYMKGTPSRNSKHDLHLDYQEDRGGGELDGSNFTEVAQSAPPILFDKIEIKTEDQNAPLNLMKTEDQNAASAFSGNISSLNSGNGIERKENESQVEVARHDLHHDEEDRRGGELDGNVTEVAQIAPAILIDKFENRTEEQKSTLMDQTEEQNAASSSSGIDAGNLPEVAQSSPPPVSIDKIEIRTDNAPALNKKVEAKSRKRRGKKKKTKSETSFDQTTVTPSSGLPVEEDKREVIKLGGCSDFSTRGRWMYDEGYPLYTYRSCPFILKRFDCQGNGRLDKDYMKWRWQPQDCDIPRFNATKMLELMRGKRLLYVGDSINRNQFESMVCMLVGDIRDPKRPRIKHEKGMYNFYFVDYQFTVEFSTSVFLVDEGTRILGGQKQMQTLRIDSIYHGSSRWRGADILVFGTGHWWTDHKTNAGVNFYQEGDIIHPYLDVYTALRKGLMTWASWVDKYTNPRKTRVFFRTSSPAHYSGGEMKLRRSCIRATQPLLQPSGLKNGRDRVAEEVIKQMKTHVTLLNITSLSEYRIDSHPSGMKDCSHWCLPGVPDAWNEMLYAHLFMNFFNQ